MSNQKNMAKTSPSFTVYHDTVVCVFDSNQLFQDNSVETNLTVDILQEKFDTWMNNTYKELNYNFKA